MCNEFGISLAHLGNECRQQQVHEGVFLTEEGVGIANGTAQDAADNVACLGIGRQLTVGNGEGYGTDMVGDDAHGDINLLGLAILLARELLDGADDGLEDVGVVVGVFALQGTHEALEAHAGVDDVHAELDERAIGLALKLHEDEVPDFYDLWVVLVDELASGDGSFLFGRTAVEVYL